LGDGYLDDPVAQMFRNIILSGTEERIQGQISLGVVTPLSLWKGETKAHIAMSKAKPSSSPFVSLTLLPVSFALRTLRANILPLPRGAFCSLTSQEAFHAAAPSMKN
jgi:hypothetical protein